MTDANTTTTLVSATKKSIWKYFGAMFMENKDGEQAISLTRTLSLVCFGMLLWKWSGFSSHPEVQDTLIYTFWGLIGGKTFESMVTLFKGTK